MIFVTAKHESQNFNDNVLAAGKSKTIYRKSFGYAE